MIDVHSIADLAEHGIKRAAISCGVFDGIHLGHQRILDVLTACAAASDAVPVVISFNPHPRRFLQQSSEPPIMFSEDHKKRLLSKHGVAALIVLNFNHDLASLSPEAFVDMLTDSAVTVTDICVGSNWRFGSRAAGDIALLEQLAEIKGFAVHPVIEQTEGKSKISSSTIRDCIRSADLDGAARLLGRPYSFYGKVIKGRGIAAEQYNYPTANLSLAQELYPPLGIYAVIVIDEKNCSHKGIMYLGNSQTDYDDIPDKPFAEVHIFNFSENIYDQYLEVQILTFIRKDSVFDSEEFLKEQIKNDVARVREYHQL